MALQQDLRWHKTRKIIETTKRQPRNFLGCRFDIRKRVAARRKREQSAMKVVLGTAQQW